MNYKYVIKHPIIKIIMQIDLNSVALIVQPPHQQSSLFATANIYL
jgi:hypothetical protein